MHRLDIAFACCDAVPGTTSEPGRATLATAQALAGRADVTLFTSSRHRSAYATAGAEAIDGIRVVLVEEAADAGGFLSPEQRYGAHVLDALRDTYGGRGPDYVELPDRGGEGAAIVQARLTRDPCMSATRVGIRAHGTDEMLRVLDGFLPDDPRTQIRHELERTALRHADVRLLPATAVDETYGRFYADEPQLAPARVVRPTVDPPPFVAARPSVVGRPLRLLVLGPLDRRGGVVSLVEALLGLDRPPDAWRLTIAGRDTRSGGLGTSVRAQLELMIAGDERIDLVVHEEEPPLGDLLRDHDVLALPDRWACWPATALAALQANRPIVATPFGGVRELAIPGVSGWLCADATAAGIAATVGRALDCPDELDALVQARGAERTGWRLADAAGVSAAYDELLAMLPGARPAPPPRARPPLVSIVIPYFRHARFVERAIASAFGQMHPEIEVLVINDGSSEPEDVVLQELAARWPLTLLAQENQGVGAARNLGIAQAKGRYVLPLDADNELDPRFATRAVEALESEPSLAWVSSWTTFIDAEGKPLDGNEIGYHPLAGRGPELDRRNIAADAAALIRRRVFELGFRYHTDVVSFEDWLLYRELRDAGHHGAILPERLISYRVLASSKLRTFGLVHAERLAGELRARQRERRTLWT